MTVPSAGLFHDHRREGEIVREVKEKPCYFALDYDTELKSTADTDQEKTFELPDGNIIIDGAKRFHCVRVFFQPSFTSKEANGVQDTSFMKCDADIRKNLYVNVVLSSGTTMSREIVERMTNELTTLAPSTMKIKDDLPDGNISTVGAERVRCACVFSSQGVIGKEASGVYDTSSRIDIRKNLYANVAPSGGTTMFEGCLSA